MQKLWSGIRSILNVGKCRNSYITSILNNNMSVDNPKYIANIFNNFFANVGKSTEEGTPGAAMAPHSILGVTIQDQFLFLSPVPSHEVWTFTGKLASLLAHTLYLLLF